MSTPSATKTTTVLTTAIAARHERLGAGHQVLLEEGAEVAARAGRPGDVGPADREGVARLAHRVLEVQVEALAPQVLDDLPGPGDALALGPLAGRRDLPRSTQ